jgi:predicted ATPase/DNA-binding winged helix-turn-helix (wHTH) protein
LDVGNACLWRGRKKLSLLPKDFAVLHYLTMHSGQLVTQEELLKAVWADAVVSTGVLKICLHRIRRTLGDKATKPRFIETAPRRGYRFLPTVTTQSVQSSGFTAPSFDTQDSALRTQHSILVGRDSELAQLHKWLEKAWNGERQIVFVTGEPGIGKTTLVDAFLRRLGLGSQGEALELTQSSEEQQKAKEDLSPAPPTQYPTPWIARGQCVEHYGVGEAYLPILEALRRLCHTAAGEQILPLLRRYAPTWLAQLPALVTEAELEAVQRRTLGSTQERMIREMADLLEALTAKRPLALWLEDLQWSDHSTLTLLLYLAQRRGPAQLLVVGTYRPADVIVGGHPLKAIKQELQGHGQCAELPLRFLTVTEVSQYLAGRFGAGMVDELTRQSMARLVHQSSDGNPLFMVALVDYLVAQGVIRGAAGRWQVETHLGEVTTSVPDNVRQLIEKQLERLSKEEQCVLETASVAGVEFTTAAVAAGLAEQREPIEEWCERLTRRGSFLAARGTELLPDGTITGRYSFLHALYQKVLYERLAAARRIRLHRRIGERGEAAYGDRAGETAAELAMHFEQGRDYRRAVHYLEQAAQTALQRSANHEAIGLLTKALALLKTLPDAPERDQQELLLQVTLGVPLLITKGYSAPEVKSAYDRARDLCRHAGESPQLFLVLVGLTRFYITQAEFRVASDLAEESLRLAQQAPDLKLLPGAYMMLGANYFFQGEFVLAHTYAEQSLALYDPQQHQALMFLHGDNPRVLCSCWAALTLWYLGYPDQALERIYQALHIAQEFSHSFSVTFVLFWTAFVHRWRGEVLRAQEQLTVLLPLAHEHGIPHNAALGTGLRGWVLAEQGQVAEGVAQIQQGLAGLQAMGQELGRPYFLGLLAEAYSKAGRVEEGMKALTEALEMVHNAGEQLHLAELYRLQGELLLNAECGMINDEFKRASFSASSGVGNAQRKESIAPAETAGFAHLAEEAEARFLKAIETARRQQAKSLELRTVMSLAKLWRRQGKQKEAHHLLSEIYNWFTEGFGTKDLQEAKTLLEDLSH